MDVEPVTSVGFWTKIYRKFSDDEATILASSLAYYTIFSLAPLLIIVISLAGFVWGADAVRSHITTELRGVEGSGGAEQVDTMMQAAGKQGTGVWASIAGSVALLFGATGVVVQLQYSPGLEVEARNRAPATVKGRAVGDVIPRLLFPAGVRLSKNRKSRSSSLNGGKGGRRTEFICIESQNCTPHGQSARPHSIASGVRARPPAHTT